MTEKTLDQLQQEAKALGIKFHHRAGPKTIQNLINAYYAEQSQGDNHAENPEAKTEVTFTQATAKQKALLSKPVIPMTEAEYRQKMNAEAKTRVGRLLRVRIQNLNPQKKEWPGEIISVGSAKLGTFKKFIPFNGEPYHIPQIIYDVLREKECSVFFNATDDRGRKTRKSRLIKEYTIAILPQLTKQELADLSRKQQMAAGYSPLDS